MKEHGFDVGKGKPIDRDYQPEEVAAREAESEANRKTMRRERSIAAIEADLDSASNAELLRFLKRMIAERVQADPKWLRRLNKAVDGDEPAVV